MSLTRSEKDAELADPPGLDIHPLPGKVIVVRGKAPPAEREP